jgi:hypothetical protein
MGPIGCPETSVLNQPTLCNNPEDGRIQVNYSESLRSRKIGRVLKQYASKHIQKEQPQTADFYLSNSDAANFLGDMNRISNVVYTMLHN